MTNHGSALLHTYQKFLEFCKGNKLETALVTTIDKEAQVTHEDIVLNFYPASVYAYVVGDNTLKQKAT